MNQPINLPSPEEFPESDVVIFDGNCNFCISQVKRLQKWDGKNRISFISLHDEYVTSNYPQLTYDEMMAQMYVVDRKTGNAYGGAKALRYLSRKLPKLWFAMPFLHVPFTLPVWQWAYRQVAKRRYKLAGKNGENCDNGSCKIHDR